MKFRAWIITMALLLAFAVSDKGFANYNGLACAEKAGATVSHPAVLEFLHRKIQEQRHWAEESHYLEAIDQAEKYTQVEVAISRLPAAESTQLSAFIASKYFPNGINYDRNTVQACLDDLFPYVNDYPGDPGKTIRSFIGGHAEIDFSAAVPTRAKGFDPHSKILGRAIHGPEVLTLRLEEFTNEPPFSEHMYAHVRELASKLKSQIPSGSVTMNFDELLETLSKARADYAVATGDIEGFGKSRFDYPSIADSQVTPLGPDGKYMSYYPRVKTFLSAHARPVKGALKTQSYLRTANLPGTSIVVPLTEVYESFLMRFGRVLPSFRATPSFAAKRILMYLRSSLFPRLMRANLTPGEVIDGVAELHWWLAHAYPNLRGSAAVADSMTKVILMAHGIEPGRWKGDSPSHRGISPDIEAFLRPLDDYVQNYRNFFE